jgi:hypothetical protein
MKLGRAGNLYVTGPGGIWIWDSDGNHLGTIVLPEQPANLDRGRSSGRGLPFDSPIMITFTYILFHIASFSN